MSMNQEKMIIEVHAQNLNITTLRIIDNIEREITFRIRRILPRLWRHQRSELATLIDGSDKSELRISTSTARWMLRDLIKNPSFIFSSLTNSYRLILEESENLSFPLHISTNQDSDKIWISRNAVKSGVSPTNLDESLEYDRLRNPKNYNLLVSFVEIRNQRGTYELFEPESYGLLTPNINDSETYFTDYEIFTDARVKHGKIATQQDKIIQISNRRFELVRRTPGWLEPKGERFQVFKPHLNVGVVDQAIFFGSNLNWFHFIVECLTRFVPIPLDLAKGTPIILESSAHSNIRKLCELLTGIPPIVLKPGEELSVNRLIVGRESGVLDSIDASTRKTQLTDIRERVLSSSSAFIKDPIHRIYLRRPPRLFRPLQNEEKIVRMLSKQGFVSIYPEKESFQPLIEILNSAEMVVVESGAAMTNLMFANKNLKVIELNPGRGSGFGFWGRFLDIFAIRSAGVEGKRQMLGFKGLAIDGYRIPIRELKMRLNEFQKM